MIEHSCIESLNRIERERRHRAAWRGLKLAMALGAAALLGYACHSATFELPETPRPAVPIVLAPPGWPEPTFIPEPSITYLLAIGFTAFCIRVVRKNKSAL